MNAASSPPRGRFDGVWHIVLFNWPFYAGALASAAVLFALACWAGLPRAWVTFALLGASGTAWLVFASLAASHWIYDRSPLSRWEWVREILPSSLRQAVNVHAGFDESSDALRKIFPETKLLVFDFYDPQKSTEASIARARRRYPPAPEVRRIEPSKWPLADASCEAVFLILAAHELRQREDRLAFFREARRVLAPEGRVVLVEHLRDLANFAAFGPGFFHFLSRREWCRTIEQSGLAIEREFSITPFVRVFVLG